MSEVVADALYTVFRQLELWDKETLRSVVLAYLPIFFLMVVYWFFVPKYYNYIPVFDWEHVFLLLWGLLAWTIFKGRKDEKTRYIDGKSRNQKTYNTDFSNQTTITEEWSSQGHLFFSNEGMYVTSTEMGCFVKPGRDNSGWTGERVWKDFNASIVLRFEKIKISDTENEHGTWVEKKKEYRQILGIIFRAKDLQNYYMVELWKIENSLYIRPHVRVDGNWDAPLANQVFTVENEAVRDRSDLTIRLQVKDNLAKVSIGKESHVWFLPDHYDTNLIHKRSEPQEDNKLGIKFSKKIPFHNHAGMFGFRNHPSEIALVRELKISCFNNSLDQIYSSGHSSGLAKSGWVSR